MEAARPKTPALIPASQEERTVAEIAVAEGDAEDWIL